MLLAITLEILLTISYFNELFPYHTVHTFLPWSFEDFAELLMKSEDRGSTVVKVLCYKLEGHWFDTSGFFIDIKSFRLHYGPGVDSASNGNEYQEHFLGLKAAGA